MRWFKMKTKGRGCSYRFLVVSNLICFFAFLFSFGALIVATFGGCGAVKATTYIRIEGGNTTPTKVEMEQALQDVRRLVGKVRWADEEYFVQEEAELGIIRIEVRSYGLQASMYKACKIVQLYLRDHKGEWVTRDGHDILE